MTSIFTQSDFDTTSDGVTLHHKNDIIINDAGQLALSSDIAGYEFIVADAIRTMKGEVQLDTDLGIDYDSTVWMNRNKIAQWQRLVRKRINQFDFVDSIQSFDAWMEGDVLKYKLVILTDLGTATVESD